jgi:hypothetical protein
VLSRVEQFPDLGTVLGDVSRDIGVAGMHAKFVDCGFRTVKAAVPSGFLP